MTAPIPLPARTTPGEGPAFRVGERVRVAGPEALRSLAEQFADDMQADSGLDVTVGGVQERAPSIRLELVAGDADSEADDADDAADLATLPTTQGVSPSGRDPRDEAYRLDVGGTSVVVRAQAAEGIFRGLTTLRQLLALGRGTVPAMQVADAPRFAWRGLSLDVGRTFLPVEEVERIVDLAVLYKLNVLHLHLTEDAGWRIDVPSRPALAEVAGAGSFAGRRGGYYTAADFGRLVEYAARRFVTVVPEIDVPGHATAALRAYPELSRTGAPEPVTVPGVFPAVLDLQVPGTVEFLADVFTTVTAMTPGPFVHIGGDEALGVEDADLGRFVEHVASLVRRLGKRVVGWQEIARGPLLAEDVVQYWLEPATHDVVRAAHHGAAVLMSPTRHCYLDVPYGEPSSDPAQEDDRLRLGMRSYTGATVRDVLDWDPTAALAEVAAGARIAGVEAALWCETVEDLDDALFLLLPRLPGVAERAWSARGGQDWSAYAPRLAAQAAVWDRRGWAYFRSSLVDWSSV